MIPTCATFYNFTIAKTIKNSLKLKALALAIVDSSIVEGVAILDMTVSAPR
jgi:hypothetical protein